MARVKVAAYETGRPFVVEEGATKGATLGVNLFDANGNVLDAAGLAALIAAEQGAVQGTSGATPWRLLLDVPVNVQKIAALTGEGIVRRTSGPDFSTSTDASHLPVDDAGWSVLAASQAQEAFDATDAALSILSAVVTTDATTARLLSLGDAGLYVRFTNAAAKTLTVQDNADEAIPISFQTHGRNAGAGDLTIVEDTSVTVNPPAGGTLVIPEGGTFTLKKVATDEWDLFGVTVAA